LGSCGTLAQLLSGAKFRIRSKYHLLTRVARKPDGAIASIRPSGDGIAVVILGLADLRRTETLPSRVMLSDAVSCSKLCQGIRTLFPSADPLGTHQPVPSLQHDLTDQLYDAAGKYRLKRVALPRLTVGGSAMEGVEGFMSGASMDGYPAGIDGVLGIRAVASRRVDFDFERNRLGLS
jgi:hypothetical protein